MAARSPVVARPVRFRPAAFTGPVGGRLRAALAAEHAHDPFTPVGVRDAAKRVATVAQRLHLSAVLVRGGLDLGGAEIDHVWAVVDDRVVDVVFPLYSDGFIDALRAFVAGDVDEDDLDVIALPFSLDYRVVGDFPDGCGYLGSPVWAARHGPPSAAASAT